MPNPLLESNELPPFSTIRPEHVEPALNQVLAHNRQEIQALTESLTAPTWDNFIAVLEQLNDHLSKIWSPVKHMNAVVNTEELRAVYNQCLPELSEYFTELGQDETLFQGYRALKASAGYASLSIAQRTAIDHALRDFTLSGIALHSEDKKRFGQIKKRLSELTSKFAENVLDATQAWTKHILSVDQLAGIPDTVLANFAQLAQDQGLEGYLITLDAPSYLPVMTYVEDRELREEVYHAFSTRASECGPNAGKWDNGPIMHEILSLRQQLAKLVGMPNYADYSLATKMAQTSAQVIEFLEDLASKSYPSAQREFNELKVFAEQELDIVDLQAWDIHFASEKLQQAKYQLSQEALRPYFPIDKVITGMFAIAGRLFNIEVEAITGFDTWHEDVRFYRITRAGCTIAKFYLDPFARANKRSGAWMDECRVKRVTENGLQLPVAYLVCNFTPPTTDTPSLLTHTEVTTLFHEFGHGLHHMLTKIEFADVSGINGVAWDAVELPSQFMENWCWQKETLELISSHYQTGETLPAPLFDKLLAAKNFQSSMHMVRQLEFALFDFRLHREYVDAETTDIQALLEQVRQQVAVAIPPSTNRFQHGFTHIFSGGYAAGYYSYKWAEVLSADAFSLFEENGIFDKTTGEKFLIEILEKGGSEEAMTLFKNFRGREPKVDALLRHCGIIS